MRIPDSDSPMQTQRILYIQIGSCAPARVDERIGGKLLLMDGKLHDYVATLERCAHMEAPWRMYVDGEDAGGNEIWEYDSPAAACRRVWTNILSRYYGEQLDVAQQP